MKIIIKTISTILMCVVFIMLISCGESQKTVQTPTQTVTNKNDGRATIILNMNGKTYEYDHIDWNYSKVDIGNDILLKIVQEGSPIINFSFPASNQHFKKGIFKYTHPEVTSTEEPLYLSFF